MAVEPYEISPPAITSGNVYLFTTDSGVEYEVRFARKKDNLLHTTVAFGVLNEEYEGEEYVVTNRGEVYRVMTTLVSIIRTYLAEHPNLRYFEFTGEPTTKETAESASKRLNLYKRYLPKIFDSSWEIHSQKGSKMVLVKK